MDNRPIGVFDSGVGGLTVVRELQKVLPDEDILYFGDTGRVPYGTRSRDAIRTYATQDIRYLMQFDVKMLVAACGTVSANYSQKDVEKLGIQVPFIEVVMPATRTACALSSQGRIGVIATAAAIRTGAYGKAVRSISPGAKVFGNACPLLVPLVENGMVDFDNKLTRLALEMYLEPLIKEEIDTLILGCTHYPLLYDIVNDMLKYNVILIDPGAAAAKEAQATLCERGMLAEEGRGGATRFRVSDVPDGFNSVARIFLGQEVADAVEYVDISMIDR